MSQIINNSSEIEVIYDSLNFLRFAENFDEVNFLEACSFVNQTANRLKERWGIVFDEEKVINALDSRTSMAELYDLIMQAITGSENWGEKTTNVMSKIDDFLDMYEDAYVVVTTRDPIDAMNSWKKFTHAPGNDYLGYVGYLVMVRNCQQKYKNNDRVYFLSYDALINDPEIIVEDLFNFLELEYTNDILDTTRFRDKSGKKWTGNSMFEGDVTEIRPVKTKNVLEDWEKIYVKACVFKNIEALRLMDRFGLCNTTIVEELIKSKFATRTFLRILFLGEGHDEFPLDPTKSENWESEKAQLNKWKED